MSALGLEERKLVELRSKLASVNRELCAWREQSEAGGALEKHHTQVRAVAVALETLANGIATRVDDAAGGAVVLKRSGSIELMILELHRIWEFFRSKLAMRYVPWFTDYLLAADEFAWNCYRTIEQRLDGATAKEPPLVFLNGGSSPFMLPRDAAYDAEEVPGEALRTERFRSLLQKLPIPVIGVPWFQLNHLPDAPVIGHEVGHVVETDLELSDQLQALLDGTGIDPARHAAWSAWLGEVFADVYGALATGPAFAATLIDFLADDAYDIENEEPTADHWGTYPTRTLRVLVATSVVAMNDLQEEADTLRERWLSAYPTHALEPFEDDVEAITCALVKGARLRDLVDFGPAEHELAQEAAEDVLGRVEPTVDDARVLTAAARIAFEMDPKGYANRGAAEAILARIKRVQRVGTRAGPSDDDDRPGEEVRDARDRTIGSGLLDLLEQAHDDGGK